MDLARARHAFITGGASGIGLGIADALIARGVPVTIADIDAASIDRMLGDRAGASLRGQVFDVRDRTAWRAAKAEAEAALGPVDILIANAGIGPDGNALADADPEAFDRLMAINVGGMFNAIQAFAGDMRAARRGHIVITGSMAGLAAPEIAGIGGYTISKFAVNALGEVLRREMAEHGVGVSTLCPGMVASNLGRNTARMGGRSRALDVGGKARPSAALVAMDPADVGEITVQGIAGNQAYIITHPREWPDIAARFHALEAAFGGGEGR
jgi:NAD(P)-dependent dehydrogenase (short-subunit alcohol dehydrogenase family)